MKNIKKYTKLREWQIKAQEGGICKKCGLPKKFLTVDHIVPISILEMLDDSGEAKTEWESNFQLLCQTCNQFKANRLDKTNPMTKVILLSLLK